MRAVFDPLTPIPFSVTTLCVCQASSSHHVDGSTTEVRSPARDAAAAAYRVAAMGAAGYHVVGGHITNPHTAAGACFVLSEW